MRNGSMGIGWMTGANRPVTSNVTVKVHFITHQLVERIETVTKGVVACSLVWLSGHRRSFTFKLVDSLRMHRIKKRRKIFE
jgi:hypothetical protein